MSNKNRELHRGLEERHLSMMALGATIGVGLFLGSASTIKLAGPAILLAYLIGGLAIFIIMRALGEMAVDNPVAGSFSRYAHIHVGPLAGYLTGWTYWFQWIVTCMAEVTAVGVYMHLWFPGVPTWIWALISLCSIGAINFIAVRAYGEFEFWFSLIKVVTIILMIVAGSGMIVFGFGNGGVPTGISALWKHGGFMPNGVSGVVLALPMVAFAYGGVEMLGLTAGEAKNPRKSLTRAVDAVFWRVLVFYVGALLVLMSIYPWNQIGVEGSPFVITFERLGIPAAAGLINFVVLTAALSSCNSGIFSTGRMLFNLAQQGQALRIFSKVGGNGVPNVAVAASLLLLLIGVLLNYLAPKSVFVWLTAIATFAVVWTWAVILLAHWNFRARTRRASDESRSMRLGLFPLTSYLAGAFLLLILCVMTLNEQARIALYIGPAWLAFLCAVYFLLGYERTCREYVEGGSQS
ncbi:amino acid permease [Pandoraea anhela]|uniref:Amino acid permease n=1 Tax=Pandoraea anhela TaxID=2508295 RepID=A0A5E4WH98_9BURK|nr:amino acid permease [Pandoraea anhela]VVE22974.1 amino acid permease [Pandoraea anhela]